jgi:hypothetical protein
MACVRTRRHREGPLTTARNRGTVFISCDGSHRVAELRKEVRRTDRRSKGWTRHWVDTVPSGCPSRRQFRGDHRPIKSRLSRVRRVLRLKPAHGKGGQLLLAQRCRSLSTTEGRAFTQARGRRQTVAEFRLRRPLRARSIESSGFLSRLVAVDFGGEEPGCQSLRELLRAGSPLDGPPHFGGGRHPVVGWRPGGSVSAGDRQTDASPGARNAA